MVQQTKPTACDQIILDKLDDLIVKCYRGLVSQIEKNAKVGDFIKMFEMRMKLTPTDQERTRFWEMLEEVRQETLPSARRTAKKKRTNKSNGKKNI